MKLVSKSAANGFACFCFRRNERTIRTCSVDCRWPATFFPQEFSRSSPPPSLRNASTRKIATRSSKKEENIIPSHHPRARREHAPPKKDCISEGEFPPFSLFLPRGFACLAPVRCSKEKRDGEMQRFHCCAGSKQQAAVAPAAMSHRARDFTFSSEDLHESLLPASAASAPCANWMRSGDDAIL